MAGLLEDLMQLLEAQLENYTDLLDLSAEKRQVIISNDVESLQKITGLENTLVSRNQKLERRRDTVIDDIALVLNKKKNGLTISMIAEAIKNKDERERLTGISVKMRKVLDELKTENDINKSLIDNSLDYIDFCMNVIHDRMTNNKNYPGGEHIGGKGFFDTKQ